MRNFLNTFRKVIRVAPRRYSAIDAERLEDRILMSAMPMVDASIALDDSLLMAASPFPTMSFDSASIVENQAIAATSNPVASILQAEDGNKDLATIAKRLELVFVNANTPNYQALLDDLLANADAERDFEVYLLDPNRDGIEQISGILDGYTEVDAIHLVSHGENGALQLGQTWLNNNGLTAYAGQLAGWQSSLASNADILIYGCDLANYSSGRDLVDAISALTGADVAASIGDTGHSQWGADWILEYHVGTIESDVAFSEAAQQSWQGKLATITVTTFSDVVNGSDGVLSLREAIIQSNGGSGGDTIVLSAGTYTLTRTGTNENSASTGDLDILKNVTINGATATTTIINGNGIDRVFHISASNVTLSVSELTIQGGSTTLNGGGVYVENTNDQLNLSRVIVTGNIAGNGAGIYNEGTANLTDVVLSNNGNNTTAAGGGLYNRRDATLNRVSIHGNQATNGGGIYENGQSLSLTNVTISGNTATNGGGGISNQNNITILNSTIANNSAAQGGGIDNSGNTITMTNTIVAGNSVTGSGANILGAINSQGFNLIQSTSGASGFVASDITGVSPGMLVLADNGGFGKTHQLALGSQAIDAGTASGAPSVDGRNVARNASIDIGAYESMASVVATPGTIQVNSTTSGIQTTSGGIRGSQQAVAVDNSGNYVVTWSSQNQDGSGWGVYARRFSSAGVALTSEILVNSTTTNDQQWARVASDASGNFVVTWTSSNQDGTPLSVYARRFNSTGTALASEFRVHTTSTGDQSNSTIAMDSAGNFIVAWQGAGPGDTDGIFARRYAANGTAIDATEFIINTDTSRSHLSPTVTMNDSGAFVVAWDNSGGVRARLFDASRTPITGELTLDSSAAAGHASIAMHSDGSFAAVWKDTLPIVGDGVYLRRYDAAGTAIGASPSVVNSSITSDQTDPSIAMDSSGNFIVVWEGNGTQSGETDSLGVFGQKYNASGAKVGGEFLINTDTTGTQSQVSVAMIDLNNFVAIWSGQGPSESDGVFVRQFGSANVAPTITSNSGGASATISVNENTSLVTTVIATDADLPAQTLTYSILGGVDAARFTINGANGQLSFITPPDFESPTDSGANNVYNVIVQVTDGALTDTQTIAVTVNAINDNTPIITSNGGLATATINVAENTTTVTTVTATDADLPTQSLTYSISGGVDSAKFSINSLTGALSFIAAPNFEASTDSGANNVYDVIVQVSDGTLTETQSIAITVTNVNDPPVGVGDNYIVQEDGTLTTRSNWFNNAWSTRNQITFNNASGPVLTDQVVLVTLNASNIDYSLTQNGGQDLRFVDTDGTVLNYEIETWNEAGTSTVWVRVPQINAASTTDSIWMYYGNASATAGQNATGVWSSSAQAILHLNGTLVDSSAQANTVTNGGTVSTTGFISGGRTFDGLNSEINVGSAAAVDDIFNGGGTLSAWINPTGWGENGYGRIADKASSTFAASSLGNGWGLQLNGSDGSLIFQQGHSTTTGEWRTAAGTISLGVWQQITIIYDSASTSNNPRIFINGVEVVVTETQAPVGTAGSDAASNLKVGNYSQSPDRTFDGAIDEFQLYNAALTSNQILANYQSMSGTLASIGIAQSGPGGVLTNDSDVEGATLSVTLGTGPTRQQSFTLNSDGSFTYIPLADYNGSDSFTYFVSDGTNTSGPITVTLTITAVNDTPMITSNGGLTNAAISLNENLTSVTTVIASDADLPSQTLTYSLSGGTDQARFAINASSGVLTFLVGPNFESQTDSDNNNTYEVIVTVSDGQGGFDTQTILVTILDANEFATGVVTDSNAAANSVNENSSTGTLVGITAVATDGDGTNNTITYSLTNSASGRFAIGSTSGIVTVSNGTLLNRESAASHSITVRATSSDGSFTDQVFTIAVADVDEFDVGAVTDTSTAANSVNENATSGTLVGVTASATDADATNSTITYSLTQTAGGRFKIDATTGVVSVDTGTLLDRESASSHLITIRATSSDGSFTDQNFTINVNDVDEFDVGTITDSNSTANTVSENAANGTSVGITAIATDADATNNTITYTLTSNAGGRFSINSTSGIVTVANSSLLNREANASHSITVRATSSDGSQRTRNFTINIADVDEFDIGAMSDQNTAANSVNENAANGSIIGITALATDADATTNTITYSLDDTAGGRFAINSASGVVTVANGILLDFESASQHNITVRATSQDGSFSTGTFTISVANSNDNPPVMTSSNSVSINENQTFVLQLTAADTDLPAQSLSFSILGGPDDLAFEITPSNALVFRQPPNFENARDANSDNVYSVVVRVSDGAGGSNDQLIQVTVTNINEAPTVLSPSYSLLQTDVLNSEPGGVLVGALDPESDPLSVSLVSTTGHGTLTFRPDGSFTYTPVSDFLGIDSFTFEVSDGAGGIAQGTISLIVSPGFIPPTPVIPQGTTIPDSGTTDGGESPSESSAQDRRSKNGESDTGGKSSSESTPSTPSLQITTQFQSPTSENAVSATARTSASAAVLSIENSHQAISNRVDRNATAGRLADSSLEYRIIREFARQASVRAAEQIALATIQSVDLVLHHGLLWNDLDHLREQIASVSEVTPIAMGTATGVASGLSVGYVMWLLRGGYIVAGVMAQLPAWGLIDPLPILSQLDDLDDEDDDSLASMVDKSNSDHDSKTEDNENNPNLHPTDAIQTS